MSKAQCMQPLHPACLCVCGRPYQACLHASGVHVAAVLFCHPSAPWLEFRTSSEHLSSNLVLTHFGGLHPHATHFRLWLGMDSVDDSGNSWGLMKLNFPIGASTAVLTWMPVCLYVAWRRTLHLMGSMPWTMVESRQFLHSQTSRDILFRLCWPENSAAERRPLHLQPAPHDERIL